MLVNIIAYCIVGLMIAGVYYIISEKKLTSTDLGLIVLCTIFVFALLDSISSCTHTSSTYSEGFTPDVDDSEMDAGKAETFAGTITSPQGIPPEQVEQTPYVPPQGTVCAMLNNSCTYSTIATDSDKAKYLCALTKDGECATTLPCKKSGDACALDPLAKSSPMLFGRTCVSENVPAKTVCRLSNAVPVEQFEGSPPVKTKLLKDNLFPNGNDINNKNMHPDPMDKVESFQGYPHTKY
jgi:hypothetical protein